MPSHEVSDEVLVELGTVLIQNADQIAHHQEELAHGRHVQHGRMNGDDHACGSVDRAERQEAKGRGRIEKDNVVVLFDFRQRKLQALEEDRTGARLIRQDTRGLVLVLHDFEVARNEIDAIKVGLADDVPDRPSLSVVVAKRRVDRFVGANIDFRLRAEHCGERCLGIEVECENAIALQSEIVRKMNTGRRLGTSALEVCDRENLQVLARATARQKAQGLDRLLLGKQLTKLVDLGERVDPMVVFEAAWRRAAPFRRHQLQSRIWYGCQLRNFVGEK
ncbi:hypothetical protein D9M72_364020 [compost metagenome]